MPCIIVARASCEHDKKLTPKAPFCLVERCLTENCLTEYKSLDDPCVH